MMRTAAACMMIAVGLWALPGRAQIAVSANDAHSIVSNGIAKPLDKPPADTFSVIDLGVFPPKLMATGEAPTSVNGPPMAVAITADGRYALVTAANKPDPQTPGKALPDDAVSVIDLKATPPQVVQTAHAANGAAGIAVSPSGSLVLVANRAGGSVSSFAFKEGRLEPLATLDFGKGSGPCGVVFTKDGTRALLTLDDNRVVVLDIDGTSVKPNPRPLITGVHPYTIDVNGEGTLAAVSNMGRSDADVTTISLIDLKAKPFRVVQQAAVAAGPEGLRFSPDGRYLMVASQENSNKPPTAPYFTDHGTLTVFRVDGTKLVQVAQAPVGHWSQGIAVSRDGKTILVQNMVEKNLSVFRFVDDKLTADAPIAIGGGPASIAVAR